jgi:hypothetical protein
MLPDTGIDDVKKQRNAEYAKHINDPVLPSLKMEGIRLLFIDRFFEKYSNFTKILSVGAELVQWDRRAVSHYEPNSRFSQFCESAKKV